MGLLPPNLNSNFFTFITKVQNADVLKIFRPIFLGNFLFKVNTKIVSHRLGMTSQIISPNNFGFIKGHQIQDYIVAASDCVNILSWKCYGGNMAMKIDIRTVFNTPRWDFLLLVLRRLGFSYKFLVGL